MNRCRQEYNSRRLKLLMFDLFTVFNEFAQLFILTSNCVIQIIVF